MSTLPVVDFPPADVARSVSSDVIPMGTLGKVPGGYAKPMTKSLDATIEHLQHQRQQRGTIITLPLVCGSTQMKHFRSIPMCRIGDRTSASGWAGVEEVLACEPCAGRGDLMANLAKLDMQIYGSDITDHPGRTASLPIRTGINIFNQVSIPDEGDLVVTNLLTTIPGSRR